MSAWPFCPQCGTVLAIPDTDTVKCTACRFKCRFSEISIPEIVTVSPSRAKPLWISDAIEVSSKSKHATIEEPCPKCNYHELYFYTMQLRSVDEGSTVFYECPKCNYKYSVNN